MPATTGTRRGNGAGWGGPATGSGNRDAGPGRPQGVKTGDGKRTVAALLIEAGARETAAERWMAILNDPAHPKHAEMVAKVAERMDGAPTARIEIADADPATMTDEQLAAIAARGRRAAANAPDDPA